MEIEISQLFNSNSTLYGALEKALPTYTVSQLIRQLKLLNIISFWEK